MYNKLCLPKSTNADVIKLKRISRRIKLEMSRSKVLSDELVTTYNELNLYLQQTRQLESDYVAISSIKTSTVCKIYQYRKIQRKDQDDIYYFPKRKMADKKGISVAAINDRWKRLDDPDSIYQVVAVGFYGDDDTKIHTKEVNNTYMITLKQTNTNEIFVITIAELSEKYYLYDVIF